MEASPLCAFTYDAPQPHRIRDALEFVQPELLVIEGRAAETTGQFRHHHGIGRCDSLNPCGQVQRLSDSNAFPRTALANQLAYHDHARGNADPDLREDRERKPDRGHRVDQCKSGTDGSFGIVLVCLRVAEVDQYAVAHALGYETATVTHRT